MSYNPEDQIEKRKRLAWSIACESSIVTKEDPVLIYDRMLADFKKETVDKTSVLNGSCKS